VRHAFDGSFYTLTMQSSGRPPPTWGGVGEPPNAKCRGTALKGWFLEWVKIGLNWVRFQFLKKAKSGKQPMFTDGFAFFELGSFSRFCVFYKGWLATETQAQSKDRKLGPELK
jgi:hypothetical protein